MTRVLFCGLLLAVWACSAPEPAAPPVPPPAATQPAPAVPPIRPVPARPAGADSVVLVRLADDIILRWNNRTSFFVEDKLFRSLVATFPRKQQRVVALILDTTATAAVACAGSSESRRLVTGDLAFSLVLRIKQIPWYEVYQMQFDSFDYNCPFPNGELAYVAENRTTVWQKTVNYLAEAERAASSGHRPAR